MSLKENEVAASEAEVGDANESKKELTPARRNLITALLGVAGAGAIAALGKRAEMPEISPDHATRKQLAPGDSSTALTGQTVGWVTWIGTTPNTTTDVNLRGMTGSATLRAVVALGFWDEGDGGGGMFLWDPSSSSGDDGGTIIVPSPNPSGGRWKRIFDGPLNVRWFGAKGDGITPDDGAIQDAIDCAQSSLSRELRFPPGYYLCNSTVQLGAATYRGIVLRGEGVISTQIWYTGTSAAVNTSHVAHFAISDLAIMQKGETGTATGLILGGTGSGGSETHVGEIERVLIGGFRMGILAGDGGVYGNGAASEINYRLVTVTNCEYGFYQCQQNTITHIFTLCCANTCDYGFYVEMPFAVHFHGGSVGYNSISDFVVSGRGGVVSIVGIDSESSAKFLILMPATVTTNVYVGQCEVREPVNDDDVTIDNSAGGVNLFLEGNMFGAFNSSKIQRIKAGGAVPQGQALVMKNNYINAAEPFFIAAGGRSPNNMQFELSMNQGRPPGGLAGLFFDDETGYFLEGYGKVVLQRQRRPKTYPFTGVKNTQTLSAVTGISGTEVEANNLCGTTPLISGSTQSYPVSFTTAEPNDAYRVTLTVTDTTPSTTAAGARRAYVTSKSASGFTINLEAAPGASSSVTVDWHLFR